MKVIPLIPMDPLDAKWIELFKEIGKLHGWDSLTSTLVATIFIEPEPVAMDELARRTGYSLASISNKLRLLGEMGMIARSHRPGTRKVFLSMEKDILKLFREKFMQNALRKFSLAKERMPEILKEKGDRRKKDILQAHFQRIQKFEIVFREMMRKMEELHG